MTFERLLEVNVYADIMEAVILKLKNLNKEYTVNHSYVFNDDITNEYSILYKTYDLAPLNIKVSNLKKGSFDCNILYFKTSEFSYYKRLLIEINGNEQDSDKLLNYAYCQGNLNRTIDYLTNAIIEQIEEIENLEKEYD